MIEREQEVRSTIRREEPFPEDPQERFAAVFGAIGNSEAKCLTLLCLSQSPITGPDLHQRFIEESGAAWRSNRNTQSEYCINTLIPIGLVTQEDYIAYGSQDYVTGFRLTEAGNLYGVPIAAYLLSESNDLDKSLLAIFGQTSKGSGETRSVVNRARILKLLSISQPLRTKDLAEHLELDGSCVSHHLQHLTSLGLIDYSSTNSEIKGLFKYNLVPEASRQKVQTVERSRTLTEEVADLAFKLKEVDCARLAAILKDRSHSSEKNLRGAVSKILSGLAGQGILTRGIFQKGESQSQAAVTPLGRQLVDSLIVPIEEALINGSHLDDWHQLDWRKQTKEAITKYKNASGHIRQQPLEYQQALALEIIRQNTGIRPAEIARQIQPNSLYDVLRNLVQSGQVRKEKRGRATCYFAV